jgi:hypothetical protein
MLNSREIFKNFENECLRTVAVYCEFKNAALQNIEHFCIKIRVPSLKEDKFKSRNFAGSIEIIEQPTIIEKLSYPASLRGTQ